MKKRLVSGLVLVGFLGSAAEARAADVGFELGARLGMGMPMGSFAEDGDDVDELIALQFPLWLDLGIRADRAFIGGYLQYGPGLLGDGIKDSCDELEDAADATPGASAGCSVSDLRLGAQVHYHFGEPGRPAPWLGVGIGYEWLMFDLSAEAGDEEISLDATYRGLEFANIQGGVDFQVAEGIALGPFMTWSLGRYDRASASCDGDCGELGDTEQEADIEDPVFHHWLFAGLRVSFLP